LINEKFITASQDELRDHVIEFIRKKGIVQESRIVSENRATVNGQPMYYMYIEGKVGGDHLLSCLYYLYTGSAGTIQFISMVPKVLYQEYNTDIMELFNGLQIIDR
jgi:hypothetical protein